MAEQMIFHKEADVTTGVLREKLVDMMTPGYQAEFDPEEAEFIGAFTEDALSEKDAIESGVDLENAFKAMGI